jgi:hypothetical protein
MSRDLIAILRTHLRIRQISSEFSGVDTTKCQHAVLNVSLIRGLEEH